MIPVVVFHLVRLINPDSIHFALIFQVPGYLKHLEEFKKKGIDKIAVVYPSHFTR
jgi:hypothetical protein